VKLNWNDMLVQEYASSLRIRRRMLTRGRRKYVKKQASLLCPEFKGMLITRFSDVRLCAQCLQLSACLQ
jgi:hypothetical protein